MLSMPAAYELKKNNFFIFLFNLLVCASRTTTTKDD